MPRLKAASLTRTFHVPAPNRQAGPPSFGDIDALARQMSQYTADMRTALDGNLPMGSWAPSDVVKGGATYRARSSELVLCDPGGSAVSVALPAPTPDLRGDCVFVKNVNSRISTNAVTVRPSGYRDPSKPAVTIEGASEDVIRDPLEGRIYVWAGSTWVRHPFDHSPYTTQLVGKASTTTALNPLQLLGTKTTTDSTPADILELELAEDSVVNLFVRVVARDSAADPPDMATYVLTGGFRRGTGGTSSVGSAVVFQSETDATWDCQLVASGNSVFVRVTGDATNQTEWTGVADVVAA